MKCFTCVTFLFLMTLPSNSTAACLDTKLTKELQALAEQIEGLKTLHVTDVTRLRDEIEELKQQLSRAAMEDQNSIEEPRAVTGQAHDSVNDTAYHHQLQIVTTEVKQALVENGELAEESRAQRERTDHLETELGRLLADAQQMRRAHTRLKSMVLNNKEMKAKNTDDSFIKSYNDVVEDSWEKHAHHLRHQKTMSNHVIRILHEQELLTQRQDDLQAQVVDLQNRLVHFQEPNWNLLSAKVDTLELESKLLRDEVKNNSHKASDFDKLHASMLELREEVESIENKADQMIPVIRKEISKLDIDYAQLNAQSSYLKEDQENLRQSVKAIAVSVSNAIDRAEMDRLAVHQLNQTLAELNSRAKQNHYHLNDHILKSEANHDLNQTDVEISLPELMGEVKELQPVESEYQDLVKQLPRDCSHITEPAGVFLIRPGHSPVEAWCVNGSTVLQRRYNGTVEFNRKFAEYVRGFGDSNTEYWLGLDNMHRLTADNCSSMRIDMTDIYGGVWYAQYEHFSVGDAGSGFVLEVSGFKGNASDAFEYQNHMEFSAKDRDRDISNTHCAGNYEGGWWFSHCQHVNINGKYTLGLTWFDSARNEWIAVASAEMRLYRRPGCA